MQGRVTLSHPHNFTPTKGEQVNKQAVPLAGTLPRCSHGHYKEQGANGKASYCKLCCPDGPPFLTRAVHLRSTKVAPEQAMYANQNDGRNHCLHCGESAWYRTNEADKESPRFCAGCDQPREEN